MRAGRVLRARALWRHEAKSRESIEAAIRASRVIDPPASPGSPTSGYASTERAWQPTYAPEHRPVLGFTPNQEQAARNA